MLGPDLHIYPREIKYRRQEETFAKGEREEGERATDDQWKEPRNGTNQVFSARVATKSQNPILSSSLCSICGSNLAPLNIQLRAEEKRSGRREREVAFEKVSLHTVSLFSPYSLSLSLSLFLALSLPCPFFSLFSLPSHSGTLYEGSYIETFFSSLCNNPD